MEVKFEVKMSQKIMYNFLLNHTYRSVSGVFGVLFGIAALTIFGFTVGKVESWQSLIYCLFGIWFLLYLPVTLYLRSAKQVKLNPVFKKPISYLLNEDGITTVQGDQQAQMKWEDFLKVTETKLSYLAYTGKRSACIFPKESLGGQCGKFLELVKSHMPADKIKLKKQDGRDDHGNMERERDV